MSKRRLFYFALSLAKISNETVMTQKTFSCQA